MSDQRIEVLGALKKEMTAAWAYLHAYAELFEHPDPTRIRLMEETAPGFFALVQTALIECVLIRLVRLMDPAESGRNKENHNLCFRRLFCPCAVPPDLTEAANQLADICRDWNGDKFQSLKKHRDKVQAHNDFPTIKGASPLVSTKLMVDDVRLLRELFGRLWGVLATAYFLFKGTSLVEPKYGTLSQRPTMIFSYLAEGLYVEKALLNQPALLDMIPDFEFHEVGRDPVMRLVD